MRLDVCASTQRVRPRARALLHACVALAPACLVRADASADARAHPRPPTNPTACKPALTCRMSHMWIARDESDLCVHSVGACYVQGSRDQRQSSRGVKYLHCKLLNEGRGGHVRMHA
eukprot:2244614-Pleurochrysis_carterae.AAC.2